MNIFVTDSDPVISAQNLDDKRVVKMVVESAQMLSTAMHAMCRQTAASAPYKKTHENHPCSIWARQSYGNYLWLLEHFKALCNEYTHRYGKIHKCQSYYSVFLHYGSTARYAFPQSTITPFTNCTPHKDMEVIAAYRSTMKEKWANDKRKPTWKNNLRPTW